MNTQSNTPTVNDTRAVVTRRRLPWLGLLLVLSGPVAYMALATHSLMLRTGLPAWILMDAGILVGVVGAHLNKRRWTRVLVGIDILLTLLFAVGFFGLSVLPDSGQFKQLTLAPEFSLPDQDDRTVSLREELAKGPVMLVFYRGFW